MLVLDLRLEVVAGAETTDQKYALRVRESQEPRENIVGFIVIDANFFEAEHGARKIRLTVTSLLFRLAFTDLT